MKKHATLTLATAAALSLGMSSCEKKGFSLPEITDFAVETLETQKVDLATAYPVTLKGKQDIEIRPQVAGFITELYVDEGSAVKKGQVLFGIDPVQYEAAVNAAQAAVNVAAAQVKTAKLTAENRKELRDRGIISDYDYQTAENNLASAEAQLSQAKANLVNAQKNLSYTKVTSPSDGVVGSIPYRKGSLVSAQIATPLTTVSDISEMYAYFSIAEKDFLNLTKQYGTPANIMKQLPALQLQLSDGTMYGQKGHVETLSGVVDPTTGAITARALFKNPDRILRSGATGNVLLPYSLENAVVVPQSATYEIQDKVYVYAVKADSTVANTEIEVFPINDGKQYVVTKGVKAGDQIAVEGITLLKDGMKIVPVPKAEAAQHAIDNVNKTLESLGMKSEE